MWFGAPLAELVYRDAEVGRYVQVLGLVAPFMYLESMVDGVLKGLGEQMATFRYSLVDSVFRIAAISLLLPRYGMAAFLGIMIASNLLTFHTEHPAGCCVWPPRYRYGKRPANAGRLL